MNGAELNPHEYIVSWTFDRGTKENLMTKEKSSTNGAVSPGQVICIVKNDYWPLPHTK